MEKSLKDALKTTKLDPYGRPGGGCINSGCGFRTDSGNIFVKYNVKSEARDMFEGEMESLKAIIGTEAILCPKPIAVVDALGQGAMLVTDYIDINNLRKYNREFGTQLAHMHQHNKRQMEKAKAAENTVTAPQVSYQQRFGFHRSTRCGILPQANEWEDNWPSFFAQKLEEQIKRICPHLGDQKAHELWMELQLKLPLFFPPDLDIVPALVHGDLWSGNAGETDKGPVIFDPACFYGHSEYEFGIMQMFQGFPAETYAAYHEVIPKQPGHDNRVLLYELFHHLNHWNHFGGGYRQGSICIMKQLVDKFPSC